MRSIRQGTIAGAALLLGVGIATQGYASVVGSPTHATHKTVKAEGSGGNYSFSPKKLTIKVGTKVTFANSSDAPHTVTSDTSRWKYDKQLAMPGKVSFTFKKAGTFKYHCTFHPSMVGTIIVKH